MSKSEIVSRATTLHVRDNCLCLYTQRAARALARRFDEVFRPLSLTNGQFSLMMALNRPDPPSVGAVALVLGMDRTTITAAVKPLARRGLVTIAPDKKDRRSRCLSLTAAGQGLLAKAYPLWEKTHREVEASLEETDADSLRAGLARLTRDSDGAT